MSRILCHVSSSPIRFAREVLCRINDPTGINQWNWGQDGLNYQIPQVNHSNQCTFCEVIWTGTGRLADESLHIFPMSFPMCFPMFSPVFSLCFPMCSPCFPMVFPWFSLCFPHVFCTEKTPRTLPGATCWRRQSTPPTCARSRTRGPAARRRRMRGKGRGDKGHIPRGEWDENGIIMKYDGFLKFWYQGWRD